MSADTRPGGGATEAETTQDPWVSLEEWIDQDPRKKPDRAAALGITGKIMALEATRITLRQTGDDAFRGLGSQRNAVSSEEYRKDIIRRESLSRRLGNHRRFDSFLVAEEEAKEKVTSLIESEKKNPAYSQTRFDERENAIKRGVGCRLTDIAERNGYPNI